MVMKPLCNLPPASIGMDDRLFDRW
jgi:hypothetical protein